MGIKKEEFRFSAELLATRRMLLNYSLDKFSKLIGVSKQTIKFWESGRNEPSPRHLNRLAKILETTPERMIMRDLRERKGKLRGK